MSVMYLYEVIPAIYLLLTMLPRKWHTLLACSMVCNRSWHLPENPRLVWHPARIIKEGGCVHLSFDTMHLKDPLPGGPLCI